MFLDPRLAKIELPNESIELSYYKRKSSRLELELSKLNNDLEFLRSQKEKLEKENKMLKGEL